MSSEKAIQDATETINLEPHWPSMFDRAVRIAGEQISTDNGQEFVQEMLQYGKRLSAALQSV